MNNNYGNWQQYRAEALIIIIEEFGTQCSLKSFQLNKRNKTAINYWHGLLQDSSII